MNIIELYKNVNIDKTAIQTISKDEIIRIEKQINVERKINSDIDVNVANNLIEALKNYPLPFQFILNSHGLFNFFTKNEYRRSYFPTENIEINDEEVQRFIEKYLQDDLTTFFDKKCIENKFEEMNNFLVYKEYFPEELLYKVSKRAEGKLDFVLSVLNANEQNYFPILYVKQAQFFIFLSHFVSTDLDDKVHSLLNEIVDIYNVTKSSEFAEGIMISMANYHSFDEELMDTIASNKRIVQNNIEGREGKSSSSGSGFSWRVFGIILVILLKIAVFSNKCSSGSSDYDNNNIENMNTIMESIEEKYVSEKNHFFDYLTDFKTIDNDSLKKIDTLKTGDKVFKSMYSSKLEEQIPDSLKINIKNKSDFDVVLLISKKINRNDYFKQPTYSVLLKKKESINVSKNDFFNFYVGNELASFLSKDTEIIKYDKEHEYRFIKQPPKSKEILKVDYGFTSDVIIRNYDESVRIETKNSENDIKGDDDFVEAVKIN